MVLPFWLFGVVSVRPCQLKRIIIFNEIILNYWKNHFISFVKVKFYSTTARHLSQKVFQTTKRDETRKILPNPSLENIPCGSFGSLNQSTPDGNNLCISALEFSGLKVYQNIRHFETFQTILLSPLYLLKYYCLSSQETVASHDTILLYLWIINTNIDNKWELWQDWDFIYVIFSSFYIILHVD